MLEDGSATLHHEHRDAAFAFGIFRRTRAISRLQIRCSRDRRSRFAKNYRCGESGRQDRQDASPRHSIGIVSLAMFALLARWPQVALGAEPPANSASAILPRSATRRGCADQNGREKIGWSRKEADGPEFRRVR